MKTAGKKNTSWGEIGKTIGKKIDKECIDGRRPPKKCKKNTNSYEGGAFYGLGFIGALIYYISTATGFWMGIVGVLKAIVWPVFLVYELLKFLGM